MKSSLRVDPVELIKKKRDGGALTADEIQGFVSGFVEGQIADYQMSAWLMAALLRGMDDRETVALTDAMLHSGKVLRLASVKAPKIDKHSTGGVGDKVSLCLGPLVAACGVAVPMISGRGLGHTGGTLDKLEAIPGYRVGLDSKKFEQIVKKVGCSMIGQTPELAPADRRIYALRDVTGTVESIPLIVASILSKKLAAGIDGLVLDVKVGRGAFMKDVARARELAQALVRVGQGAGKRVVALLTDMWAPLGSTIGNALETREAIDVLRGAGPSDTRDLTIALGVEMLLLARVAGTSTEARGRLEGALRDGAGLAKLREMVRAHGGDVRAIDDPERLPRTRHVVDVLAARSGWVSDVDALELGLTSVAMGAGRTRADQKVDPAVGMELVARRGDRVSKGAPIARLHVHAASDAKPLLERVANAFTLSTARPRQRPLVLERITSSASSPPSGSGRPPA